MKAHFIQRLICAGLLAIPLLVVAEDIDLFVSPPPVVEDPNDPDAEPVNEAPNVLLILDNAANFSANVSDMRCRISAAGEVSTSTSSLTAADATALDGKAAAVEQCALYAVIKGMDVSNGVLVNIGVMGFNANGMKTFNAQDGTFSNVCSSVSGNGGCLLAPIVPLNATTKANLLNWIKNWEVSGGTDYNIKGNGNANGASMQEAWAYFTGVTGISGRNYSSIKPSTSCNKNNVIFIGNAYRNNSSPGDQTTSSSGPKSALDGTNITALMRADPAATTLEKTLVGGTISGYCNPTTKTNPFVATLETSESKGVYALNWARYMKNNASVTTYSIGVLGPTCNAEYAAHLTKLGDSSLAGGKYFPTTDFAELVVALNKILVEIQSVNSVFAAVSLPVSVNTQGTYLNQVYIGMFRPDAEALPRWDGNMKQFRLGMVGNELRLLDAQNTSTSAINSQTGFITECARSYWTPTTVDSYWAGSEKSEGACTAIANSAFSNYPDGNIVEKGGHAYKLRTLTPANRNVKTCSAMFATCSSTSTLTSFDAANTTGITQAMLDSTAGATNRTTLINWARGLNVSDELGKGTSVMRPSTHGDVVHSRPVAVNHGTDEDPDIVLYYGGNDGLFRAVNGNRDDPADATKGVITSAGTDFAPGTELWSFMPPEFYGSIKRIYDNDKTINFKGSTIADALPKQYGFDGPVTAFNGTIDAANKVLVYAAMRRGGRVLYAFDTTTPATPTLKWKKGCPNNFPSSGAVSDADCSADFTQIGQTWSAAKTIYATGYGSGSSPLLIMGGGYDTCEDTDDGTANHSCSGGTKGNRIYVLDAATGAQAVALATDRAVTGDVTIVKDDAGKAMYAYATDLGGNVYRISGVDANTPFASTAPSAWTITKIASLGCDDLDPATACNSNRKFLYGPDVVYDNGLYIILVGSGDREKPLSNYSASYGVPNYFFMIKDNPGEANWLSDERGICDGVSVICKASLYAINDSNSPDAEALDLKKGWALRLAAHEQVVTSSITVFGTTTFSTHQPAVPEAGSCGANLGISHVYNIAYTNAASKNGTDSRYETVSGGGLPPSPVAGRVTLDDGQTVPFCIGCNPNSPLEGGQKTNTSALTPSQYKSRVYWYIQQ